jgi:hypothetical protein
MLLWNDGSYNSNITVDWVKVRNYTVVEPTTSLVIAEQKSTLCSRTVKENETLTITLSATDPDGDTITYGNNATFGNLNGNIFTWTPDYENSGVYYLEFNASDGSLVDSETVTITVNNVNRAPVLSDIISRSVNESETLTITLNATDPDRDSVIYSTNATFGNLTENVFIWTPGFADNGMHSVQFMASDGLLTNSENIIITVNESYTNFRVSKRVQQGDSPGNYTVTLKLTSNVDFNAKGIRAYDLIPADFTMASPIPAYNSSQGSIYYWTMDLAAGENKTVTYNLVGTGSYSLKDAFTVGVDPQ